MYERLLLNFHGLGTIPDTVGTEERPYWCSTDRFAAILDGIPEVTHRSGVPVEITFDDGNASDAVIALPALAQRGFVAAFFVCAGRIGLPGYLDGAAMAEILAAGMTIGSHGWAHVDWRRAEGVDFDRELDGARDRIAQTIGQNVDQVAIPFGSYDRRVLSRLRHNGTRTVFTSDGGRAPASAWLIPRETYSSSWGGDHVAVVAERRMSHAEAARQRAVRTIKRWR